jgi:RNA polymerase II subunit A-like phosphatase
MTRKARPLRKHSQQDSLEDIGVTLTLHSDCKYDINQLSIEWLIELNQQVSIGQTIVKVFLPLLNQDHLMQDDGDDGDDDDEVSVKLNEKLLPVKHVVSSVDGQLKIINDLTLIRQEIEQKCNVVNNVTKEIQIQLGTIHGCSHAEVYNQMCVRCGKMLNLTSSQKVILEQTHGKEISMMHEQAGLKIRQSHGKLLDQQTQERLLNNEKKLVLVLDIDHTLLHATNDASMLSIYEKIIQQGIKLDSIHKITSIDPKTNIRFSHLIKFRPNLINFLNHMHQIFELHIFTHGNRTYANSIKLLLDPEEKLFGNRVISRTEMADSQKKDLDHIFPSDDRAIIILDDNIGVWHKHKSNVYHIVAYEFWRHCFGIQSEVNNAAGTKRSAQTEKFEKEQAMILKQQSEQYSMSKMVYLEKRESDNQLFIMENLLQFVHDKFFEKYNQKQNVHVKDLMVESMSSILAGCKLLFSGILDKKKAPEQNSLWRRAQRMGAQCTTEMQSDITHVIAGDNVTEKVRQARQMPGVFIVHLSWLEESYRHFDRLNEADFFMYTQNVTLPIHVHYAACADQITEFQQSAQSFMKELQAADHQLSSTQTMEDGNSSNSSGEEEESSDDEEEMLSMFANASK